MKTTAKYAEMPKAIQAKANKQAPVNAILQSYRDKTAQRQSAEEEELLQGKFEAVQKMELEEEEPIQGKFETMQLQSPEEEELLQGKLDTAQLKSAEEEELLQGKFSTAQLQAEEEGPLQKMENNTGLPDNLKSGVEHLSGYRMDDVKVHYNSAQPATLQAHAYAQGTDIHIAPGQEKYLPHEAWHVVQQKQGRVKPTMQMKATVPVNDDAGLEKEADVMGTKALQMKVDDYINKPLNSTLDINNVKSIQRKVLINNVVFTPESDEKSSPVLKDAIEDEYLRYYENKEEALDHIDKNVPGNFGLIRPRALWYRIPYLNTRFFVFGEHHSAVKGSQIKAASNITAPILDEARSGWNSDEMIKDELEKDNDTGLDENSSKLLRALEMWRILVRVPTVEGGAAPSLPKIPRGDTSIREERGGTKRLIVHGEGGEEEYWKPTGAVSAPSIGYDPQAEMLAAIEDLFEKVFAVEISKLNFEPLPNADSVSKSWGYFKKRAWIGQEKETNIKINVCQFLYDAAKQRASLEYAKLDNTENRDKIRGGDRVGWKADDYRDEHMFVRILEAQKQGSFAFANMGNAHLMRLKSRFEALGIPYILVSDFFDSYTKDAIDTKQIAYKNSPEFRKNQRLVLWLRAAFIIYPNLQQMHLDMLNNYDLGEFVLKGSISKWEHGDMVPSEETHHKPVLFQLLKDLKKAYPNSDDFISDLTLEELGEFLTTEKIRRWEAM
ncbi:DUF4157 domain-containing protein [Pedobacter sp. ASV28]|uniref:eCIS core domain-containing protein n=1 Tax=Pedobacter sp. ASV28 TaxID=2795123 RepID=UPI0018EB10A6|nr:DUF4157 domain-containing protein [Pedobacter sp. ASV28]